MTESVAPPETEKSESLIPTSDEESISYEPRRLELLPVELITTILGFLDHTDHYILANTCRRIRSICARTQNIWCPRDLHYDNEHGFHRQRLWDTWVLARKLRADTHCVPCFTWETWAPVRHEMRCSACKHRHPARYFTEDQKALPDDSRECIGATGLYRLCVHKAFSYKEVFKAWSSFNSYRSYQNYGIWVAVPTSEFVPADIGSGELAYYECPHPDHKIWTPPVEYKEKFHPPQKGPRLVLRVGGPSSIGWYSPGQGAAAIEYSDLCLIWKRGSTMSIHDQLEVVERAYTKLCISMCPHSHLTIPTRARNAPVWTVSTRWGGSLT